MLILSELTRLVEEVLRVTRVLFSASRVSLQQGEVALAFLQCIGCFRSRKTSTMSYHCVEQGYRWERA